MEKNIAVIKGDGIGPEIVTEAMKVLDAVAKKYNHKFNYTEILMGGCSIDAYGVPLSDEALKIAKKSDSVLLKELESKIKHQKYINIQYEVNGKINKFEVKPYKIIFINENFYLACEIEHEILEFAMYRLSKIKSVEDTPKTFHKNIEIEDFIKDMQTPFSIYRRDYKKHLLTVILEVDKAKAFYFESKKYLKSQEILEKKENGNLLIKYKITQEMEIEELIKKWIPFVKVIEPLSLKEKIASDLRCYLNTLES